MIADIRTQQKAKFLHKLGKLGTVLSAAKAAGIGRSTAYEWRDEDEQFRKDWAASVEDNTELLEQTLFQRAIDGDTTAAIFMLKAMKPQKYRERYEFIQSTTDLDETIEGELAKLDASRQTAIASAATNGESPGQADTNGKSS